MSERDEERAAAEFVARHFPETTRFVAEERLRELPVFGPFEIQGGVDEPEPPVAVVQVAFALTRPQLVTVLGMAFAGLGPERSPESLTDDEVRREVEGQLAAEAIVEIDHQMEHDEQHGFTPKQQRNMDVLAAAVDRAYPAAPASSVPAAVRAPRSAGGTVTVETLDYGPVTLPEPFWCLGQHDPEGYREDISHEGEEIALTVSTGCHGEVRLGVAALTQRPFSPTDTRVLAAVEFDELHEYDAAELADMLDALVAWAIGPMHQLVERLQLLEVEQ